MGKKDRLASFLREVSNWTWEEFAKAEKDKNYSTNQAIIFGLVRACSMQKMDAIRVSLHRLDGKLKTPVRIEMPKVFYTFPYAQSPGLPTSESGLARITNDPNTVNEVEAIMEGELLPAIAPVEQEQPKTESDLATMSLRETLTEMSDYPRTLPDAIIALALQTEQSLRGDAPRPEDGEIPKVKSVVSAHLLVMAQNRNMDAIGEVFDQIDGKLVETIQILGEDIYITSFATIAPDGAYLNDEGILQIEAIQSQQIWAQKLEGETK